jgi:hypothetical protein
MVADGQKKSASRPAEAAQGGSGPVKGPLTSKKTVSRWKNPASWKIFGVEGKKAGFSFYLK